MKFKLLISNPVTASNGFQMVPKLKKKQRAPAMTPFIKPLPERQCSSNSGQNGPLKLWNLFTAGKSIENIHILLKSGLEIINSIWLFLHFFVLFSHFRLILVTRPLSFYSLHDLQLLAHFIVCSHVCNGHETLNTA